MRPLRALAPVAEATSSAALASHCAAAALQLLRGFGPHGAR